jgi:hypothetical protein
MKESLSRESDSREDMSQVMPSQETSTRVGLARVDATQEPRPDLGA